MQETSSAPIPLVDLKAQYRAIREPVRAAIDRVMDSQHFILGPEVDAFECEFAAYVGAEFAVGVASGSDALLLALMALDIRPGDEVITTPFTFFATAGAVARLGAIPVFVDIDPATYNIDAQQVEDYLSGRHPLLNDGSRFGHDPGRVKAIIPVHLYGQMADVPALAACAAKRGIAIIEDAAQAVGSRHGPASAGTVGAAGCFSFFPSKNLGAAGDAGAVVTNDAKLDEKLRILRAHGSKPKYFHRLVGMNSRLDALQAAILRAKLPHLDAWSDARARVAAEYDRVLAGSGLGLPHRTAGGRHIFHQYVVRSLARDRIQAALKAAAIGCEVYYPLPLHLQECFAALGYRPGDLPHSESAALETLALPMYPELSTTQQERVAAVIRSALG
jgi:dTDP-4-amino-4,6-dideoxygalactose transaminase